MKPNSVQFKSNVEVALLDPQLQRALRHAQSGFIEKRRDALAALDDVDGIKARAREIKEFTLQHLDAYLELFEENVQRAGGQVHWASTPAQAREIIVQLCNSVEAKRVTKSKSMVGEEIGVNQALERAGVDVLETDLGEYIIQLAEEPPSHIIAPAIHKTKAQVAQLFLKHHHAGEAAEPLDDIGEIVDEARAVLREGFLSADVGITGANFLVAESGSIVLVTNEGNADLTHTLPKMHIVTAGIDKLVPSLDDVSVLLRLLARHATGQAMSCYTSVISGPKSEADLDGPQSFHVVLLDNGRSQMLGNEFRDMLRCIRCGACMNHCPVYGKVGGHAYGWVYPGPMGSVLTPMMIGIENAGGIFNACTMNGRCQEACPMGIPLPSLLRRLRVREHRQGLSPGPVRMGLKIWSYVARRPMLYRRLTRLAVISARLLSRGKGRFKWLPGMTAWTSVRDLPAPQGKTFSQAWQERSNV